MEENLRFKTGLEDYGTIDVGIVTDGEYGDGSMRLFMYGLNPMEDGAFEELITIHIPGDPAEAYGENAVYLDTRYMSNLCDFFDTYHLGEFSGHIGIYGEYAYPLYFLEKEKILKIEEDTCKYFEELAKEMEVKGENNESKIFEESKVS